MNFSNVKKSDKELAKELESKMCGDEEIDHSVADDFLCDVLRQEGFEKLAATFESLSQGFWYA